MAIPPCCCWTPQVRLLKEMVRAREHDAHAKDIEVRKLKRRLLDVSSADPGHVQPKSSPKKGARGGGKPREREGLPQLGEGSAAVASPP